MPNLTTINMTPLVIICTLIVCILLAVIIFQGTKKTHDTMIITLIAFFLVGVLLIFFSALIDGTSRPDIVMSNVLSALGQTCVASVAVSVFVSIKSIRDYLFNLLKEMIISHRYLEKLHENEIEKIHHNCHQLQSKGFDFKNEIITKLITDFHDIFKNPICTDQQDIINCELQGDYIIKEFRTSYTLKNPNSNINQNADLELKHLLNIPSGALKEEFFNLEQLEITIDDEPYNIEPDIVFQANNNLNNKTYNTFINVIRKGDNNLCVKFKEKVHVKAIYKTKVEKSDTSYTKRFRYPTEKYNLTYMCKDKNVKIVPQFFAGFGKRTEINIDKTCSSVHIQYNKLILPGSGTTIVLDYNQ